MAPASLGHDIEVERAIAKLAVDREHGATHLAHEALDILEMATESFPEEGLGAYLDGVGVLIVLSRPGMAAVKNAVSRALADGPLNHPGHAKRAFDRARSWIEFASRATVEETAAMIPDGAVIITCSYSGTVLESFIAASNSGKRVNVIAMRSEVGGVSYGDAMAEQLKAQGIAVEVVRDDMPVSSFGPMTMGLIGADRIAPDGSLVNGEPSLLLAEGIHDIVPLYVAAETFKLDDGTQMEEGFEEVPPELIAGYVTDRGVVHPLQAWDLRGST